MCVYLCCSTFHLGFFTIPQVMFFSLFFLHQAIDFAAVATFLLEALPPMQASNRESKESMLGIIFFILSIFPFGFLVVYFYLIFSFLIFMQNLIELG